MREIPIELPPEFDHSYYRAHHSDLKSLHDAALEAHYADYGKLEGRATSIGAVRSGILPYVKKSGTILEIGPFNAPAVSGPNVTYFDVLSTDEMIERARSIGYDPSTVPDVNFVSRSGDLRSVDRKFDAIVSSHAIEHQPDLIRHLNDVAAILRPDGRYYVICPDKRYCFDHFIAETTIAGVIQAHEEKRTIHTLGSVIEHRAMTTHNDVIRHWNGDHEDPGYMDRLSERTKNAIEQYREADGQYIDVHAWQFTPDSFRKILTALECLGEITLAIERVYQTPRGQVEFIAVLRKLIDKEDK